jgi:seryl-tRNA synthetase
MDKKSVEKKTIIKEITKEKVQDKKPAKAVRTNSPKKNPEVENILIENFVSLQKVMVNLSVKFDSLTTQISKLLELFEISAKALTEKDVDIEKNNRENAKILEKIENVLEQNKTIARGLTLMHDKINEPQNYSPQIPESRIPIQQKPLFKPVQRTSMVGSISEEFHRPISSDEQ